jgi:hypothetical protein
MVVSQQTLDSREKDWDSASAIVSAPRYDGEGVDCAGVVVQKVSSTSLSLPLCKPMKVELSRRVQKSAPQNLSCLIISEFQSFYMLISSSAVVKLSCLSIVRDKCLSPAVD